MVAAATAAQQPESPPSDPQASTGRDANGRFTKGNRGGPGNPYARQVAALRQALLNQVTAEDLAAITQALVAKAKEGDVAAAKLVFNYVLGKPQEAVPPDRLDADEWQCWEGEAMRNGNLNQVLMHVDVEPALEQARSSFEIQVKEHERNLGLTTEQREIRDEAEKLAREQAKKNQEPPSPIGGNGGEGEDSPRRTRSAQRNKAKDDMVTANDASDANC